MLLGPFPPSPAAPPGHRCATLAELPVAGPRAESVCDSLGAAGVLTLRG